MKSNERKKVAAVHFTAIPWEPNTAYKHIESHILKKFVPVHNILACMLGLKFFELLCAFL